MNNLGKITTFIKTNIKLTITTIVLISIFLFFYNKKGKEGLENKSEIIGWGDSKRLLEHTTEVTDENMVRINNIKTVVEENITDFVGNDNNNNPSEIFSPIRNYISYFEEESDDFDMLLSDKIIKYLLTEDFFQKSALGATFTVKLLNQLDNKLNEITNITPNQNNIILNIQFFIKPNFNIILTLLILPLSILFKKIEHIKNKLIFNNNNYNNEYLNLITYIKVIDPIMFELFFVTNKSITAPILFKMISYDNIFNILNLSFIRSIDNVLYNNEIIYHFMTCINKCNVIITMDDEILIEKIKFIMDKYPKLMDEVDKNKEIYRDKMISENTLNIPKRIEYPEQDNQQPPNTENNEEELPDELPDGEGGELPQVLDSGKLEYIATDFEHIVPDDVENTPNNPAEITQENIDTYLAEVNNDNTDSISIYAGFVDAVRLQMRMLTVVGGGAPSIRLTDIEEVYTKLYSGNINDNSINDNSINDNSINDNSGEDGGGIHLEELMKGIEISVSEQSVDPEGFEGFEGSMEDIKSLFTKSNTVDDWNTFINAVYCKAIQFIIDAKTAGPDDDGKNILAKQINYAQNQKTWVINADWDSPRSYGSKEDPDAGVRELAKKDVVTLRNLLVSSILETLLNFISYFKTTYFPNDVNDINYTEVKNLFMEVKDKKNLNNENLGNKEFTGCAVSAMGVVPTDSSVEEVVEEVGGGDGFIGYSKF